MLAIRDGEFEIAQRLIDETRDLLDIELTSMAGESYERAYGAMVCVQMLSELEEVIQYKLIPERRETIRNMWWKRLQGGQKRVEDWQRIIQVFFLLNVYRYIIIRTIRYHFIRCILWCCHRTRIVAHG